VGGVFESGRRIVKRSLGLTLVSSELTTQAPQAVLAGGRGGYKNVGR
jgi:hypothetical protein